MTRRRRHPFPPSARWRRPRSRAPADGLHLLACDAETRRRGARADVPRQAKGRWSAGTARSRSGRVHRPPRARRRPSPRSRAAASSPAAVSPAGPAPTTATRRSFANAAARGQAPFAYAQSVAYRWSAPISIGGRPSWTRTQSRWQSTSTGQTRAHVPPRMFSAKIVDAAEPTSPVAIAATKVGTSTPAGHPATHGAGACGPPHSRQRSASARAASAVSGGRSSRSTSSMTALMSEVCGARKGRPSASAPSRSVGRPQLGHVFRRWLGAAAHSTVGLKFDKGGNDDRPRRHQWVRAHRSRCVPNRSRNWCGHRVGRDQ